jgi:hypothetical protein
MYSLKKGKFLNFILKSSSEQKLYWFEIRDFPLGLTCHVIENHWPTRQRESSTVLKNVQQLARIKALPSNSSSCLCRLRSCLFCRWDAWCCWSWFLLCGFSDSSFWLVVLISNLKNWWISCAKEINDTNLRWSW